MLEKIDKVIAVAEKNKSLIFDLSNYLRNMIGNGDFLNEVFNELDNHLTDCIDSLDYIQNILSKTNVVLYKKNNEDRQEVSKYQKENGIEFGKRISEETINAILYK